MIWKVPVYLDSHPDAPMYKVKEEIDLGIASASMGAYLGANVARRRK